MDSGTTLTYLNNESFYQNTTLDNKRCPRPPFAIFRQVNWRDDSIMERMKGLLKGSPLERPAKTLRRLLKRTDDDDNISEWDLRARRDDALFVQILKKHLAEDSNCIDIGAHTGAFLSQFLTLAPLGHHFAFEPIPSLAAQIRQQFPNAEVANCALSDFSGSADFYYVPDFPGWSGLKTQHYPLPTEPRKIQVEVNCLDAILDPDYRVDFIKVDVEGAELNVFQGARQTLRKWRPIILFEHAQIHAAQYGSTPNMLFEVLVRDCGLKVYHLDESGPMSEADFVSIYLTSFASNYDRRAETNFVAKPL